MHRPQNVQLTRVSKSGAVSCGAALYNIVYHDITRGGGRIVRYFPPVQDRFGESPAMAMLNLMRSEHAYKVRNGAFGALTVRFGDSPIGTMSYEQNSQDVSVEIDGRSTVVTVDGPMWAVWLGAVSYISRPSRMLPGLLERLERVLKEELDLGHAVHGKPWTFLQDDREDRGYMRRTLATTTAFGGFEPVGEPARYPELSNLSGELQVWVAKKALGEG